MTSRMLRTQTLIVALTLACGGSLARSQPPAVTAEAPVAVTLLAEADAAHTRDDRLAEIAALGRVIEEFPDDPAKLLASLRLARLLLDSAPLQARQVLQAMDPAAPAVVLEEQSLLLGVLASRLGDHELALQILVHLAPTVAARVDRVLVERAIAISSHATGALKEELLAIDRLLQLLPATASTEGELGQLRTIAPSVHCEALPALTPGERTWQIAAAACSTYLMARGDRDGAMALAEQLTLHGVALPPNLEELDNQQAQVTDPNALGVLVSLTGRGREAGQDVIRGMQLYLGLPFEGPPAQNAPRLAIRDDEGNPETARAHLAGLAEEEHVIAIVGPIDPAVEATVGTDSDNKVANWTLVPVATSEQSTRRSIATTLSDEARALMMWNARSSTPSTGRPVLVVQGTTPAAATYVEALRQSDLPITRVVGLAASTGRSATEALRAAAREIVASNARRVVILCGAQELLALVSAIKSAAREANNAPVAEVIAMSLSTSGEFSLDIVRRSLEGLILVGGYSPYIQDGDAHRFTELYRARFNRMPSAYAAYGYEAAKQWRQMVTAGATTREAFAQSALPLTSITNVAVRRLRSGMLHSIE